jgi:hypothetical protein
MIDPAITWLAVLDLLTWLVLKQTMQTEEEESWGMQ